jgi:hypothetical protein
MAKKKTATAVAKLDASAMKRLQLALAVVCVLDVACSMGLLAAYGCSSGICPCHLIAL